MKIEPIYYTAFPIIRSTSTGTIPTNNILSLLKCAGISYGATIPAKNNLIGSHTEIINDLSSSGFLITNLV